MDAIPFWGNTGALGLSDSMVHITPYSNKVPETYTSSGQVLIFLKSTEVHQILSYQVQVLLGSGQCLMK